MASVEKMLSELCETVPRAIVEAGLPANACILAGRLAVEALRARGVRARPLPVTLRVLNAPYARRILAGQEPTAADAHEWREGGCYALYLGSAPPDLGEATVDSRTGGWSGHLVVIVAERYLLDLTAHQLRRLKRNIDAQPFWAEGRDLARGRRLAFRNEVDGALWVYEPTGDRGFLAMPAWSAYRVVVRGGQVRSERFGPRPDAPVAGVVAVPLPA